MEGLAYLTADAGHSTRAMGRVARLLGAAAAIRDAHGAPLAPVDQGDHERALARVRAALGPDGCAAAWAVGQAMPLEEVIPLALEEVIPLALEK